MNSNEILNYKYFYDHEDFVNWQIENPEAMITQVIPVLDEVKTIPLEGEGKLGVCSAKIFVLYYEQKGESIE